MSSPKLGTPYGVEQIRVLRRMFVLRRSLVVIAFILGASAMGACGNAELTWIADYSDYKVLCSRLHQEVKAQCVDETDGSEKQVLQCQLSKLEQAGMDATNDDGEVYCIEPFKPFQNKTKALFHSCPFVLSFAEGVCYTAHKNGNEPDFEACVVRLMTDLKMVGLPGVKTVRRFSIGKQFRQTGEREFQCKIE